MEEINCARLSSKIFSEGFKKNERIVVCILHSSIILGFGEAGEEHWEEEKRRSIGVASPKWEGVGTQTKQKEGIYCLITYICISVEVSVLSASVFLP